jgi:hypothetical protein
LATSRCRPTGDARMVLFTQVEKKDFVRSEITSVTAIRSHH